MVCISTILISMAMEHMLDIMRWYYFDTQHIYSRLSK